MPIDIMISASSLGVSILSLTADILSLRLMSKSQDMDQTFALVTDKLTAITKTIEGNVSILDKKDAHQFKTSAQELISTHRTLYTSNERRRAGERGRRRRELKQKIHIKLEEIKIESDELFVIVQSASNMAKLKEISNVYNLSSVALEVASMDIADSQDPFQ